MQVEPCVPCCVETQTVNIPGSTGASALTTTTASFVIPAANATVQITVGDTTPFKAGQNIYVGGANFMVSSIDASTLMTIRYLSFDNDTAAGVTVASGSVVAPGTGHYEVPITLDSVSTLTDNSTGSAGNTIAAGPGIYTVAFHIQAATIANGDLMTNYVPGHKFKILKFDARCAKAVTTGGKASTLNLEINTTDLTGGVISLSGTYALGAAQAGTSVSGNNTGSATDSFSIEASATTAFSEGEFWLIISIQNMDEADAVASMASKINSLLNALT